MRERLKTAHLHVLIDPETLLRIDDYRHQRRFAGDVTARATGKSDAIRTLLRLALMKELPPAHLDIINRMRRERAARRREEPSLVLQYRKTLERTHIVLEPREREATELYRVYAEYFGVKTETRADIIRHLLDISLDGKIPDNHLSILEWITTVEPRTRERAHQKWVDAGAIPDESKETAAKRWCEAKVEILAADKAAITTALKNEHVSDVIDVITHGPSEKAVDPLSVGNTDKHSYTDDDEPKRPDPDVEDTPKQLNDPHNPG